MCKAWGSDPKTVIRPVTKNCYLAEFTNQDDLLCASLGGPWTYRGDLVASSRVSSNEDLKPEHIQFVSVWVQFHNLPVNCLKEEGFEVLGQTLGTLISLP